MRAHRFRAAAGVMVAMLLIFSGPGRTPTALADTAAAGGEQAPAAERLTLAQALDLAVEASRDLRQAERDLEQARIKRDETWDHYVDVLKLMYDPTTGTYVTRPGVSDPTPAVYQTDFAYRKAEKNLETKKDTVVRRVYEKYYAVVQAESALRLAELEAEDAAAKLKVAEARQAVGLETALSVAAVRSQKSQAETARERAQVELEQAWQDLALLLGKPASWRAELVDRPAFSPLEVADLEAEIARIVEESPGIWEAEESIDLLRNTYGMTNSYEYDRLSLDKAYDALAEARETTTKELRNAYQRIKNLETSYAAAEEAVATARETLRVRRLMYEVGMATQADVVAARAALAKAEDSLLALSVQHELAVMAFFKPWAAGAASAATPG